MSTYWIPRKPFERMHFFPGFFTSADDWTDGQNYHLWKRQLHNISLHTPGILRGIGDDLKVYQVKEFTIKVGRGAALDELGRIIYLSKETEAYNVPQEAGTYFVRIKYFEERSGIVDNKENPDYSGYKRVTESFKLEITNIETKPDKEWLELARIKINSNRAITATSDSLEHPGGHIQIDQSHVKWAGSKDEEIRLFCKKQEQLLKHYLEKHQLKNRTLHTPGILRGELDELTVKAAGGLNVNILRGSALDGDGNLISLKEPRTLTINKTDSKLPRLVYIAIKYNEDNLEDYLKGTDTEYTEVPQYEVREKKPDNKKWLELARIDLQKDVTEISDPESPDKPGGNQIDRRQVKWAGAVGVTAPVELLTPELCDRLIDILGRTRQDFAALDGRFPIPSAADVRHVALTMEMLVRNSSLRPEQLLSVLVTLKDVEESVEHELGKIHPYLIKTSEFEDYQDARVAFTNDFRSGKTIDDILSSQEKVTDAANKLSRVVLQVPEAVTGPDQSVRTNEDTATITLDGSSSRVYHGQNIERYRWILTESHIPTPVAKSGTKRVEKKSRKRGKKNP